MAPLVNFLFVSALIICCQATADSSHSVDEIQARLTTLEAGLKEILSYTSKDAQEKHAQKMQSLDDTINRLINVVTELNKRHHHCSHTEQHQEHMLKSKSEHDNSTEDVGHVIASVQNFKENLDDYISAECNMRPNSEYRNYTIISKINGKVYLRQPKAGGQIEIMAVLKGFPLELGSLHGFHIHRLANVGESCENTGGHYNPYNVKHGAPHASTRHIGDFGNIERNDNGDVYVRFHDRIATLTPGVESIVGRTLVVHEGEDDLGTKPGNGNAGKLIACCVIVKN